MVPLVWSPKVMAVGCCSSSAPSCSGSLPNTPTDSTNSWSCCQAIGGHRDFSWWQRQPSQELQVWDAFLDCWQPDILVHAAPVRWQVSYPIPSVTRRGGSAATTMGRPLKMLGTNPWGQPRTQGCWEPLFRGDGFPWWGVQIEMPKASITIPLLPPEGPGCQKEEKGKRDEKAPSSLVQGRTEP